VFINGRAFIDRYRIHRAAVGADAACRAGLPVDSGHELGGLQHAAVGAAVNTTSKLVA